MRNSILFLTLLCAHCFYAQTKEIKALQEQVDGNKQLIIKLQNDVNAVVTENIYLKDVLDIQKPIKEIEKNNTHYKVIAVTGNKEKNAISIELLVTSKDKDKSFISPKSNIVDILGNQYKHELFGSHSLQSIQYKDIPLKMTYVYSNLKEQPKFIKIFDLKSRVKHVEGNYSDGHDTSIQLRDLPVNWE